MQGLGTLVPAVFGNEQVDSRLLISLNNSALVVDNLTTVVYNITSDLDSEKKELKRSTTLPRTQRRKAGTMG